MFPVLLSYCALELYLPSIVMQWAQNRFVHRKLLADFLFDNKWHIQIQREKCAVIFIFKSFLCNMLTTTVTSNFHRKIHHKRGTTVMFFCRLYFCLSGKSKMVPRKRKSNHFKYRHNCSLYAHNQLFGATSLVKSKKKL